MSATPPIHLPMEWGGKHPPSDPDAPVRQPPSRRQEEARWTTRGRYWHEGEPRIIASGRWEQDELGDVTYIPDHVRPSTAADPKAPAGADGPPVGGDAGPEAPDGIMGDVMGDPTGDTGYRGRSERTWAAARRDYLAGDAAEAVCARYDLKLGTLRSRAAREGWRRSDVEDVWPDPHDEDPALLAAVTPEPDPDPAAALEADLKAFAEVARDAARLCPPTTTPAASP